MNQPRAYTKAEVRKMFLEHVPHVVKYWAKQGKSVEDACEGTAFSILSMIDGSSYGLPSFKVVPAPHPEDKEYHIEQGENYFPDGCDIAGCLHDNLGKAMRGDL